MTYSLLGSSRQGAFIAVATATMVVSACSANTDTGGSPASPLSHSAVRAPLTDYSWKYIALPDVSSENTEVRGINNSTGSSTGPEIVGVYFTKTSTTVIRYDSFTASLQGTATVTNYNYASYPRVDNMPMKSAGTQMSGIATQANGLVLLAGWVNQAGNTGTGDNYATLDNQGLWSLLPAQGQGAGGQGGDNSGYLFGVNDNQVAVGSYTELLTNTKKTKISPPIAYEALPPSPGPQYINVPFPSGSSGWTVPSSAAYGIDHVGDMVGTIGTSSTNTTLTEAWYALCKNATCPHTTSSSSLDYCWQLLNYGNSKHTVAYGITDSPSLGTLVVGSYQDSSGTTHGFLLPVFLDHGVSKETCNPGTMESIDAIIKSKPAAMTVVRGINNAGDIVGWYISSTSDGSVHHGFVGTFSGSAKRRRSHR
jgi:hypothetical protein